MAKISFTNSLINTLFRQEERSFLNELKDSINTLYDNDYAPKLNPSFRITSGNSFKITNSTGTLEYFKVISNGQISILEDVNISDGTINILSITATSDEEISTFQSDNGDGQVAVGNNTDSPFFLNAKASSNFLTVTNYDSNNLDGIEVNVIKLGNIFLFSGSGSPLGVITAPIGSMYLRTDGSTNTTLYIKEANTDNTGWVAK